MALRAAELEVLFTAKDDDIARAEKSVRSAGQRIEGRPIVATVRAEEKTALAGMDRVEQAAKRLVSRDTALTINANIDRAEASTERIEKRLDYLRSIETTMDVKADVARAEAALEKARRNLDGLKGARAEMVIDADGSPAETVLADVEDAAGESGGDAGDEFGKNILAALASIPVAGAVIGIGVAAAAALVDGFNDGLRIEATYDRLQALTGVSEQDALRLGRAAGEAYANNFGSSIESNMDTARLALQFNIIDEDATTRATQNVIQGLSGISDVLGGDVKSSATAVSVLLSTGMATSAQHAFDIIAAGARNGLDRNEDLLDTLTEYPSVLTRLGLTGEEMLGLIAQGMEAGARNTDVAADALKEFQIRAVDGLETSAAGFAALGLSAEEMTEKIARGGEGAREGLDQVLDGLRAMTDPVAQNAAAVALFGTKAEDLGAALFAMDLSSAVEQLGSVTGAAQLMFDTLTSNDASRIETAQRNIEVAAEGIKGALAAAFSEPIGDFAEFVSANRGEVMQFMLDLANGALDFGDSMVEGIAAATEGLGEFISGPLEQAVEALQVAIEVMSLGTIDTSEFDVLQDQMRGFGDDSKVAAEQIRTDLGGAIDTAREKLNAWADPVVALGYVNDATYALAGAIDAVGYSAETGAPLVDAFTVAQDGTVRAGSELEGQIRGAIAALEDQISAAADAEESQEELAARYETGTAALSEQLQQMGLTDAQARALIDTVLSTPPSATTAYGSNAVEEQGKVQALADRITTLPDGTVIVTADTSAVYTAIRTVQRDVSGTVVGVRVGSTLAGAHGGIVEFMASGGIPDLTPMGSIASMVPASTWRVVGDRGDVPEAFIPMDGSQRSRAILDQANRMMPGYGGGSTEVNVHLHNPVTRDLEQDAWEAAQIIGGVRV